MKLSQQIHMMGTTIDLLIEDDQADLKLEIACQLLDIYNKRFSANDSESELSQINHQAGLKPVQIHPELFELIKIGKKESLSTPSNLNIALGPVTQAWHIGFPDAKLPDSQEIQKLLLLSNPEMIILDEENLTVFLQQSCYLSDLAVHRDYQSRKVGATLIEHVEKELGDEVSLILLASDTAMDYYPKIGFNKAENAYIKKRKY